MFPGNLSFPRKLPMHPVLRLRPILALSLLLAAGCTTRHAPPTRSPANGGVPPLVGGRIDDIARQERRIRELREEIRAVRTHLDTLPSDSSALRRLEGLMASEEEARAVREDIKQAAEDERLKDGRPSEEALQREDRHKDRILLPH
jgi:hypothetical protein